MYFKFFVDCKMYSKGSMLHGLFRSCFNSHLRWLISLLSLPVDAVHLWHYLHNDPSRDHKLILQRIQRVAPINSAWRRNTLTGHVSRCPCEWVSRDFVHRGHTVLPGHTVRTHTTLQDDTKPFPKVVAWVRAPTQLCTGGPGAPHSLQCMLTAQLPHVWPPNGDKTESVMWVVFPDS